MVRGGGVLRASMVPIFEEYLEWLLADKHTRRVARWPATEQEFAELKGTTTRTLRRWRDEPDFQEKLEQRREQIAARGRNGSVGRGRPAKDARVKRQFEPPAAPQREADRIAEEAAEAGVTDEGEQSYLAVKSAIRTAAEGGDGKALELYMRHWGNLYAEQEREQHQSSFPDLSDDELVARLVDLAGAERLRAVLGDA